MSAEPGRRLRRATDAGGAAVGDARAMQNFEYLVVPLDDARKLKRKSDDLTPGHLNELGAQGWEAVGLSQNQGDLVAWPVVLLKRPVGWSLP